MKIILIDLLEFSSKSSKRRLYHAISGS